MIKQLFFSLLLTSTALQSMELVLSYTEPFNCITEQICNINQCHITRTRKDIAAFSKTNKTLYTYYNLEKTKQNIVRQMAIYKNMSDRSIADFFRYKTIAGKIDTIFTKINKDQELTENDVQDSWYLNSTTMNYPNDSTLLLDAIKKREFTKAKLLITAGINCNNARCSENPLVLITTQCCEDAEALQKEDCLDIIKLLLENKIHPDSRKEGCYSPTLLHIAVGSKNKNVARLALEHGANPHLKWIASDAFEIEELFNKQDHWLAGLIYEIEKNKQNS